jgi:hypothetical protein
MSEYNREREAERAKTARLRELRLAKEAADKKPETKLVTKRKRFDAGKSGPGLRLKFVQLTHDAS